MSPVALKILLTKASNYNRLRVDIIYVQISWGVARRTHVFILSSENIKPVVFVAGRHTLPTTERVIEEGLSVVSYLASVDPLRYQIDCLVPKLSCKIFTNDQGADESL